MMDNPSLRLIKFIILWLFTFIQSIYAQEGFLSINCCGDQSKFTDPKTNITWISDEKWFDRGGCLTIARPVLNNTEYDKTRIFYITSGKICYNLPTNIKNSDYLLRATFLVSDEVRNSDFGVSIGASVFSSVRFSEFEDLVLEGIFRANDDEFVDFCLVTEKENPYVSKIELRNLVDSQYLVGKPSYLFNVYKRINVGGDESQPDIRYPDDPTDRIWKPKSRFDPDTSSIPTLVSANASIYNANVTVPLSVLQTALTHSDRLEFLHNDLHKADFIYTVFLYFLELNDTVKSGQRLFDIYINDVKEYGEFDILAKGSNYGEVFFDIRANGSLNLTLVKVSNGFEFGPICNAYEILQEHSWVSETNQNDVNVMKDVKSELLVDNNGNEVLGNWYGDPCLPVSWKGLGCESSNGLVAITKLDLMSSKLRGSIPSNITALTHLKKLNLSYNGFTGRIPSFPDSSMLLSVDLSHNDLTGWIPPSLASLHHLAALYFGCNPHLSKELPDGFNRSKVASDYGLCGRGSKHRKPVIIIGTVACGSFLFTVAISIVICVNRQKFVYRRKLRGKGFPITKNAVFSIPSTDDVASKSISIKTFSLEDIETATQNYKTLIGEGGFGAVYRGTLRDGQEVGVKVRSATSTQGTREFENELKILSAIRHENLVPLLGSCCEKDQQILVYPFMSNGSLQDRLYGEAAKRKVLDWPTRLSIALGAARGLTYLHSFAGRCVIHRDVKSSNILLDQSMCAKMADFGFSKYAPQEGDSGASLEVRGTAGYLDPEYYSTQHLSAKSDVFSYGVVLLEIISGREPLNIHRPRNEWSLVEWAKPFIRESKIEEIVDPNIKGGYHAEAMWRVVEVALACIEPFSAYRPSMADIVRELEDAFIIENNASEYMKSIDSMGGYSLGGSNRYSIVLERRTVLPPTPNPPEPSPITSQTMAPVEPR